MLSREGAASMRPYMPASRWPSRPYPRILPPMFVTFFQELKAAGLPVTLREFLTLMQAMDKDLADRRVDDFYYLSRAALVKDERNLDKFDRVFARVFKGLATTARGFGGGDPGGVAQEARREISHRRREAADRGDGRPRQAPGNIAQALAGAERPPPRRQQMDRHRGYLSVRRLRLQSQKAFASGRIATGTSARSRFGTGASSRIWTTGVSSVPAT